jgi:UDP-3-O-[3-hydroxymyristoyl] glucosamine N-acyltransferase
MNGIKRRYDGTTITAVSNFDIRLSISQFITGMPAHDLRRIHTEAAKPQRTTSLRENVKRVDYV